MNERLIWDEIIDELLRKFKSSQNYNYSIIKKEIEKFKDRIADDDYCKLLKWAENNFGENKNDKGTFGANFVDLIRNGFFFDTKNLMGSFAEEVIDEIAQIEKDEIIKDKKVEDVSKIKKNIKEKIGDSFLRDNLLYFKKSDKDAKN